MIGTIYWQLHPGESFFSLSLTSRGATGYESRRECSLLCYDGSVSVRDFGEGSGQKLFKDASVVTIVSPLCWKNQSHFTNLLQILGICVCTHNCKHFLLVMRVVFTSL